MKRKIRNGLGKLYRLKFVLAAPFQTISVLIRLFKIALSEGTFGKTPQLESEITSEQIDTKTPVRIRKLSPSELAERASTWIAAHPQSDPVTEAITKLQKGGFLSWSARERLEAREAEFKSRLLVLFQSTDPADEELRMGLASRLAEMGVLEACDYIVGQLENPNQRLRWLALNSWDVKVFPPKNDSEMDRLLSFTRDLDPNFRHQALSRISNLDEKIAGPILAQAVQDRASPNRFWILIWLLRHNGIENYFDSVVELLRNSVMVNETEWGTRGLCYVVQNGPMEYSRRARVILEEFFVNSNNQHKLHQGVVREFVRIAAPSTLLALQTIFEQASDWTSKHDVVTAIARLNPELALKLISSQMDIICMSETFLNAFTESASPDQWQSLAAQALKALTAKKERFHLSPMVIQLLMNYGGADGRAVIQQETPNLWSPNRMVAQWQLHGWSIHDFLRDMHKRRLIDSLPDLSIIEKARQRSAWASTDALNLHEVLREAGILREVPSETDELLAEYGDLLAEFSKITDGVFAPQYCQQIHLKQESPDSLDILSVSFATGSLLFEYEANDLGPGFDVVATGLAVDAALEWTEQPKRLLEVYTGDEINLYFWGDPIQIRELCLAYAIPLMKDLH